jgi:hypothetical protein
MTTTFDTHHALKQDVAALEQKRQLLEQIVHIIRAIECMHESLSSVQVMGVASKGLPKEVLNLYSSISDSLRTLPIIRINEYYANLELIVTKQLNRILNYSGIDFSNQDQVAFITLSSDDDAQSPVEMLNAFKRTAQTAVSLRVLLRKRGEPTPGSVLPASAAVLEEHLNHLETQEQLQRKRIKGEIEEMKEGVTRMITNPAYPEAMKVMLREVVDNLNQDMQLLERGASVERLSFVAETEENAAVDTDNLMVEEIVVDEIALPVSPITKSSFSKAAVRWLNSPWDVCWEDLNQ